MDFAFLNAVTRSAHFPPLDPWLAPSPALPHPTINYYYFGYLIQGLLLELSQPHPRRRAPGGGLQPGPRPALRPGGDRQLRPGLRPGAGPGRRAASGRPAGQPPAPAATGAPRGPGAPGRWGHGAPGAAAGAGVVAAGRLAVRRRRPAGGLPAAGGRQPVDGPAPGRRLGDVGARLLAGDRLERHPRAGDQGRRAGRRLHHQRVPGLLLPPGRPASPRPGPARSSSLAVGLAYRWLLAPPRLYRWALGGEPLGARTGTRRRVPGAAAPPPATWRWPRSLPGALILGSLYFLNSWDFPAYFLLAQAGAAGGGLVAGAPDRERRRGRRPAEAGPAGAHAGVVALLGRALPGGRRPLPAHVPAPGGRRRGRTAPRAWSPSAAASGSSCSSGGRSCCC